MPAWYLVMLVFFTLVGACVGSFLNVVIYRLPRAISINDPPRSACPLCGNLIAWYDNVPVLSWFVLRARCRRCGGPISARYVVVESVNAALWAGLFCWYFVLAGRTGFSQLQADWPAYLLHCMLLSVLLAASAIDLDFYIIPLSLPWVAVSAGMVVSGLVGGGGGLPAAGPTQAALAAGGTIGLAVSCLLLVLGKLPQSYPAPDDTPADEAGPEPVQPDRLDPIGDACEQSASQQDRSDAPAPGPQYNDRREVLKEVLFLTPPIVLALLAAKVVPEQTWAAWTANGHVAGVAGSAFGLLAGGGVIWVSRIGFTLLFGREALGLGDVHLMAGVGAVLGWQFPILAFLIGPVLAIPCILIARMVQIGREIPFGPWLSAGTVASMLFYDQIEAYVRPGLEGIALMLKAR